MQVKVGIWLTDVDCARYGQPVFVPGSHRQQYLPAYSTHEAVDGEKQLLVRHGTITIMNTALWHRTAPNRSDTTRINLYLGYSPSWLPTSDRNTSDPVWLASLNREQRIIMRSYPDAHSHAKPPVEDVPLFLDRDADTYGDESPYRDHVHLLHRKRITAWNGSAPRAERYPPHRRHAGPKRTCMPLPLASDGGEEVGVDDFGVVVHMPCGKPL